MTTIILNGKPVNPEDKYLINVALVPVEDDAAKLAALRAQLAELKGEEEVETNVETNVEVTTGKVQKNKLPGKPDPARRYIILKEQLPSWGRIPQQQSDLAEILLRSFEVGVEVSESDVFDAVSLLAKQYESLRTSAQDPTYLFRYYRGLNKKDGKHAGYVARNFLRVL